MRDANKVRIICDPYKKEIEYSWFDYNYGSYRSMASTSKLTSDEYVHASIQNRAYAIVDYIDNEYNVGNTGLDIDFIGTKDDYDDLCDVIKAYFTNSKIKCIKNPRFYNSAESVKRIIEDKFAKIKESLDKTKNEKVSELIYKFTDTVKPSVSLCVMGLYSSGKSAFINSLIGAEILPSASDPTTARVCKINCDRKYEIRFWFDKKECILTFDGESYRPNQNCEQIVIKDLQGIISSDEQHNEVFHMNRALKILNSSADYSDRISDIIEVRVPFVKSKLPTDEVEFIIYDTPGSNSASNIDHFRVLKESLEKQTNALPIFITTPETMDSEDNDKILKEIERVGNALDTTNTLVIINKADREGDKTLSAKKDNCQNLKISKWKSSRLFFLSSLVAIASKKKKPEEEYDWFDENMWEKYTEIEDKYLSDKKQLFKFNIIDKAKTDDRKDYPDDLGSTHLYINSGLEAIESEITYYARKCAMYNKCHQASSYLQKAIEVCVDEIAIHEAELNENLQGAQEQFNDKQKELCDKLEARKNHIAGYNTAFQELISKFYEEFIEKNGLRDGVSEDKKKIREKLSNIWKDVGYLKKKEKHDNEWAISEIQSRVNRLYKNYITEFCDEVNKSIGFFWNVKSGEFRTACQKVVLDSDALNEEQKEILNSIVLSNADMKAIPMTFDLREVGAIRKPRIWKITFGQETFDPKPCSEELIKLFQESVRKQMGIVVSNNNNRFIAWTDSLIKLLKQELCAFNHELSTQKSRIETINKLIVSEKERKNSLEEDKNDVDRLLDMQGE